MSSIKTFLIIIFLSFQLSHVAIARAAQSIDNLVKQGKLTIDLTVQEKKVQIVGQPLTIAIEISTNRWFASGNKIEHFTLKNVVMRANNTITINSSKAINGSTWATQTHEITLYPTEVGTYLIPAINVDVSINSENDGVIKGRLQTQESSFQVTLPKELEKINNFFVSSQANLIIDSQFDEDKEYAIGEAITQTFTITATDTPAMMLPPLNLMKSNKATLEGLSIYHKPAQVFDKSNRGELLGTRIESFTYIFEKAGSYTTDEQVIYWWNSQLNTLETILIPAKKWIVTSANSSQYKTTNTFKLLTFTTEKLITIFIALLLSIIIYLCIKKRHQLAFLYNKLTKHEQRLARKRFYNAIKEEDYLKAVQHLYQYSLITQQKKPITVFASSLFDRLNQLAFNDKNIERTLSPFTLNDAKALINKMSSDLNEADKVPYFTPKKRINLSIK